MATSNDASRSTTSFLTGYLLNVFLHGMLSVQTWEYYLDYPNDGPFMKLAVYTLYATETAQTILVVYLAFVDLALNGKTSFNAFGVSGVVLGSAVAFIVETFYARRINLLSRRRWLTGVMMLLAFGQLGTGMFVSAIALKYNHHPWSRLLPYNMRAYLVWFGAASLSDSAITAAMVTLLLRNDIGPSTTGRHLTKRVLKLTIESGAITTTASILCFTLIAVTDGQLSFTAILQSLPKLYSNSLLVQLNSRSKPYEIDLATQLDHRDLDLSFVKNSTAYRSHPRPGSRLATANWKGDDEPPQDQSATGETAYSATLLG